MTTTTAPARPAPRPLSQRVGNAARRRRVDQIMRGLLLVAVACALVPLAIVLTVTIQRGLAAFGWEFLSSSPPFNPTQQGGGYLPMIVGTIYMTAIAAAIAVPLGIAAAVFLVEFSTSRLVPVVRFFADVMTGVPSIFVGLFVFSSLVVGAQLGFGTLPGSIALAVLMLPIVVRSSEEVLRLVPNDLRNAAYGLGSRHHQVVRRVVLPAAGPGLATSAMLAVARGAGETAPLLLTALGAREVVLRLTGRPQAAIPIQVLNEARTPFAHAIERAWAGALTLLLLVLLFTIAARMVARRSQIGTND